MRRPTVSASSTAAAETHGIDTQAEHARREAAAQKQRTCMVRKNIEKRKKPAQGFSNHSSPLVLSNASCRSMPAAAPRAAICTSHS